MEMPGLGTLISTRSGLRSAQVALAMFGGKSVHFLFSHDAAEDAAGCARVVSAVLAQGPDALSAVTGEVYAYYRDVAEECAELDLEPPRLEIREPADVWRHVRLGDRLRIARATDGRFYVSVVCHCAWEEEHGLELVLEGAARVTKVGPADNRLTNASAYGDPALEGVVYVPRQYVIDRMAARLRRADRSTS